MVYQLVLDSLVADRLASIAPVGRAVPHQLYERSSVTRAHQSWPRVTRVCAPQQVAGAPMLGFLRDAAGGPRQKHSLAVLDMKGTLDDTIPANISNGWQVPPRIRRVWSFCNTHPGNIGVSRSSSLKISPIYPNAPVVIAWQR